MKRFTVRKVKRRAYSRQGWLLKDYGFKFVVCDREWHKNKEMANNIWECDYDRFKYIETADKKEVAQFFANWLNVNRANEWGHTLSIPGTVFQDGLKLY